MMALLFFGLAIAAWQYARRHPDDIGQVLGNVAALSCLLAGAIVASPLLQGILVAGLLLVPRCILKSETVLRSQQSRLYLLGDRGQPQSKI